MALCITDNLTACSRSDIKKTKSNTETGYKITWYANVLQKNISNEYEVTDKIKYIGDYPNKNGKTYIVVDGKFYKENDILYCLEWQNNKRYVYKEFTMCDLLSEKHIIFAITIMEDEIVVAHKSFNEEIIKPDK